MKKFLMPAILMFITAFVAFGFDYWYMDVEVENLYSRTSSVQRVYFFKDIATLERATGFPRNDTPGGVNRFEWKSSHGYKRQHDQNIFDVMRRDGFAAAFYCSSSGTAINGKKYWTYTIFLIRNGLEYHDVKSRYDIPVKI